MQCNSKNGGGESCEEALNLLATTVEGAESWLWPLLLEALLDPECSASVSVKRSGSQTYDINGFNQRCICLKVIPVLRALTPMALRVVQDEEHEGLRNDFKSSVVLGKCLELLSDDQNHFAVFNFMRNTAKLLGSQLEELWNPRLLKIMNLLQSGEQATENRANDLHDL